jgi:hypothetical protein
MFEIFKHIFSGKEALKTVSGVIDEMVYTKEEKADNELSKARLKINTLNAYNPFKLAQRVLAIGITLLIIVLAVISVIASIMNAPHIVNDIYEIADHFKIDWAFITIIAFYFAGGTIESMNKSKK